MSQTVDVADIRICSGCGELIFPDLYDRYRVNVDAPVNVFLCNNGSTHTPINDSIKCNCYGGPTSDDPADEHAPDCPAR